MVKVPIGSMIGCYVIIGNLLERNGEQNLTEYLELKREWEKFLKKRYLGVITRSKAKWV